MEIGGKFARYVSQNILGMIGLSAYVLADTYFISVAEGATGIAALNLVIPVYAIIYAIGAMVGVGAATRFAILRAQGDLAGQDYFSNAIHWLVLFSIPFVLLGLFGTAQMMRLLGATGEIVAVGTVYSRIFLLFTALFMCNFVVTSFVRNDGDPTTAMRATLFSSLFNIVADWILMFPLQMGMAGAALATAMSPLVSILVCLHHFRKPENTIHLHLMKPRLDYLLRSCQLGISAFVGEVTTGVTTMVFNFVILALAGEIGVAAYGVVANTAIVATSIFNGIAQGAQPLFSDFYGRGKKGEMRGTLRLAVVTSITASLVILLLSNLIPDQIVAIFNSAGDARMAELAVPGVRTYFIGYLFAGLNIVMAGFFAAISEAVRTTLISVLRGFVMIIAFALILPRIWGMTGVWLAFPAGELATLVVSAVCYGTMQRRERM